MSSPLLLGIDAGTTAVKAALFDCELRPVAAARRPVAVVHPRAGAGGAGSRADPRGGRGRGRGGAGAGRSAQRVLAAGLDHQGESVLAWEAGSGRALTPGARVAGQAPGGAARAGSAPSVVERSGLPLDPYFSAGQAGVAARARGGRGAGAREAGSLRLGTVDAFLGERLGARFATDLSTASRTQLLALWRARLGRAAAGRVRAAAGVVAARSARASARSASCARERWPRAAPAHRAAGRPAGGARRAPARCARAS